MKRNARVIALMTGDLAIIHLSFLATYWLIAWFDPHVSAWPAFVRSLQVIWLVAFLHIICLYAADLYRMSRRRWGRQYQTRLIITILIASALSSAVLFFVPEYILGRRPLLLNTAVLIVLLVTWRELVRLVFPRRTRRLAIVGCAELIADYHACLADTGDHQFEIVGELLIDEEDDSRDGTSDLARLVEEHRPSTLIIELSRYRAHPEEVREIFQLQRTGLHIVDAHEFFKDISGRFALSELTPAGVLAAIARAESAGTAYYGTKRALDIFGSLILLLVSSPIILIAAIAIKAESRGPVFFVQERLGLGGKPFACLKLRTMIDNAEAGGPQRTSANDSRITPVGALLRKLRIDELPQLLNVLLGQMSLVGPRPIREHFVNQWSREVPFYDLRLLTAPGLTGWAQVSYDTAAINEDQRVKMSYDLYYLERQSFVLDIYILIRTLRTVVSSRGQSGK